MTELEDDIFLYLNEFLTKQFGELYRYSFSNNNTIEIYAISKVDENEKFRIINICISEINKQIYIPNIYIPMNLRYKGIGKKMIYIIFIIGVKFRYEVFAVQLIDSFKERLLKRGAIPTNEFDTLQIVESTKLL